MINKIRMLENVYNSLNHTQIDYTANYKYRNIIKINFNEFARIEKMRYMNVCESVYPNFDKN